MKIGYARVSTQDQMLDRQVLELERFGCEKIFCDKASGGSQERPGLKEALEFARKSDQLAVVSLDRLGRSLKDLIEIVGIMNSNGVGFVSLRENIDTTSSSGRLFFHLCAAMAEYEKSLIRERVMSGLSAAKMKGRIGGRPSKMTPDQVEMAKAFIQNAKGKVSDLCKTLGVSRATVYRHINLASAVAS